MFKFRFIYTCFLSLVLMTSYRQAEINEDRPAETLEVKEKLFDKFFSFLKGEYNTKNQNGQDSKYFNIFLVMFPIWEEERDARYFYVEQAIVSKEDKPYRQRVYKI